MNNNKKVLQENNTMQETNDVPRTKEKKGGWFHSLTRRKKTQSQLSINSQNQSSAEATVLVMAENQTAAEASDPLSSSYLQTDNNNEPLMRSCNVSENTASADTPSCSSNSNNSTRKRKDEKNAFQRFRKRMGLRFPSLRRHKHSSIGGATTDASSEFLTHSPIHEPLHFNFKRSTSTNCGITGYNTDENDMIPFTNDFKRFIRKKWLEHEKGPNLVMYEASCEMLKYVRTYKNIHTCNITAMKNSLLDMKHIHMYVCMYFL